MAGSSRVLLLAVPLLLGGCAAAREVMIEKGGGTVALPANAPAHRAEAEALMHARCPGGFEIVREEEAVTGSTVRHDATADRGATGAVTVRQQTFVRDRVEWRIHYRCLP